MSLSLTTADWLKVNQLIYRINSIEDESEYESQVLDLLQLITPFSIGIFNLTEQTSNKILAKKISSYNISEECASKITQIYLNNNNYIIGLCLDTSGNVARGPSIQQLNFDSLENDKINIFPNDPERSLSMILYHKDILLGYIILIRDEKDAPFTQNDSCALGILKNHISLQLYTLTHSKNYSSYEDGIINLEKSMNKYNLSKRELEVLYLIVNGTSDQDVCQKLFITTSTFKKHLNHIYIKLSVNNRVNLLKLVDSEIQKRE